MLKFAVLVQVLAAVTFGSSLKSVDDLATIFSKPPVPLKNSDWARVFEICNDELYPSGKLSDEQASILMDDEGIRWRRRTLEWLFTNIPAEQNARFLSLLTRVVALDSSPMVQSHALLLLSDVRFRSAEVESFLVKVAANPNERAQAREQALKSLAAQVLALGVGESRTALIRFIESFANSEERPMDIAAVEALGVLSEDVLEARSLLAEIAEGSRQATRDAKETAIQVAKELRGRSPMRRATHCERLLQDLI